MSSKASNTVIKSSCDKLRCNLTCVTQKKVKVRLPKKLVISKKWHQNCSHEVKSQSAGIINPKQATKPKKTTRSEATVSKIARSLDFCKNCGDTDDDIVTAMSELNDTSTNVTNKSLKTDIITDDERLKIAVDIIKKQKHMIEYYKNENFDNYTEITNITSRTSKTNIKNDEEKCTNGNKRVVNGKEVIQEYYKNEKFEDLYDSMHEFDNGLRNVGTLDTITEVNEKPTPTEKTSEEANVHIVDTSDEETNVKKLKKFRDSNYFECHSTQTRVKTKANVTSLKDHKCSYRFYLNDRLFPVALNRDHNDITRCVDCHLPLELSSKEVEANGTIQAKVKLGSDTQDMMLLVPVREPLIVQQRRKEKNDTEVVYFGVIKLDQNGNSVFSRSLPSDSLALRYQKGYREFDNTQSYIYDEVDGADVIVI